MDEFLSISLEAQDRFGSSSITLEGLDYEDAREEIGKHLDYVFQTERFVDLTLSVEIKEETLKKISRRLEKVNYKRAKDALVEFLKYAYHIKEEYLLEPVEGVFAPSYAASTWLSNYDIESLTQKDKVFLLIKHNHSNQWIRSQDLQEEYELVYGEKIKLSSLSTYLARFYEKGALQRKGSRAQREYLLSPAGLEAP
jgi:hypothetical protein